MCLPGFVEWVRSLGVGAPNVDGENYLAFSVFVFFINEPSHLETMWPIKAICVFTVIMLSTLLQNELTFKTEGAWRRHVS